MSKEKDMEFTIHWCPTCNGTYIRCPKCGNNSCGGGYGKVDGKTCDVCPLSYQFQHLYGRMEQLCTCPKDCTCEYGPNPELGELGTILPIMIKPNEKCPVHGEVETDPECPVHGEKYKLKMNKNFSDFEVKND